MHKLKSNFYAPLQHVLVQASKTKTDAIMFCLLNVKSRFNLDGIYLFKVNNRKTRTKCEICSKLTIKTPEQCQWCRSGVFIVNSEHISHLVLVFLLLTLKM